jgi:hypothetical protein
MGQNNQQLQEFRTKKELQISFPRNGNGRGWFFTAGGVASFEALSPRHKLGSAYSCANPSFDLQ